MTRGRDESQSSVYFLVGYTALSLIFAGVIYGIFCLYGRSFLYVNDGVYQHFAAYRYVSDYLLKLIRGETDGLSFFNYSLGQGADILTTLNSYDFTDPICWLTALAPMSLVNRYTLMVFVKLYLIGLSFGVYCRTARLKNSFANVMGAIAYTFSCMTLFTFARHPNYINWGYFFPLIMAGGELYWRKGRKGLLLMAVFLNVVVSFYTFYMSAILFALYVVIRVLCWSIGRELRFGEAMKRALRTAGVCLIGAMLSMIVLMPTLYAYVNNARLSVISGYTNSLLHYPPSYPAGSSWMRPAFSRSRCPIARAGLPGWTA